MCTNRFCGDNASDDTYYLSLQGIGVNLLGGPVVHVDGVPFLFLWHEWIRILL